jgi:hypothetical protein
LYDNVLDSTQGLLAKTTSAGKFPPKLSPPKSRAEHDFVWRSDLSKALQSPEQKAILFQEATPSKFSKVQSGTRFLIPEATSPKLSEVQTGTRFCSEKRLIAQEKRKQNAA